MSRIIREAECRSLTGLGRTTRWNLERRGLFPTRRRLTESTVGWLESEVVAWVMARKKLGARELEPVLVAHDQSPSTPCSTRIEGPEPMPMIPVRLKRRGRSLRAPRAGS